MQYSQWTGNGKAIALHGARIAYHPAALPVVAPCKNGERLILRAFGLPGAADWTWQPDKPSSLQAPPDIRLPPFMDQHQAGVDSATEVDRHFESCGFSAVHPGTRSGISSAACRYRSTKKNAALSARFRDDAAKRGSVGYALVCRLSRQDRKRSTAFALKQLTPRTTAPGALGYKSAPSRESGLPPSLPASPAVTASMAPLSTRAPTESKLAPCASSARHLRSAPLAPLTQPGKAPMTRTLRHGSPPARYSANEEKDHGLRKAFLQTPATQKAHIASACKKSLLRLTGKQQAEYSLPHENPAARLRLLATKQQHRAAGTSGRSWPASLT